MASKFTISTAFKAKDQMTSSVKRMNKAMAGFSKTLRFIKAAFVGGVIVKAIGGFAKKGDEIAKTARQIGLPAEALQELRFAADRQGVTSEILTKSL